MPGALAAVLVLASISTAACQNSRSGPWVASSRGEVYYWADCSAAERLAPQNRIYFHTRAEAREAGYRLSSAPGCEGPDTLPGSVATTQGDVAGAPDGSGSTAPADARPCTIQHVSDGDSVICANGERVRLLLIDTPERAQEPYGDRARQFLRQLIPPGTTVGLEADVQAKDRYGRTLAYLWLPDGTLVNEQIARAGYAVSLTYPPNVRRLERIRAAVEQARQAERGLWSTGAFECMPRDFRAGRCG